MFANGIYILDENRTDDDRLFARSFDSTVGSAILNQYLLSLGEFDTQNFSNGDNNLILWLLFTAATFIS